jgi:hypothetical protein
MVRTAIPRGALSCWLLPTVAFCLATFASGCASPPGLVIGEECVVNSDCAAPLGCFYGSCRRICVASRDCRAGLRCLIPSGDPSGACQLPTEANCTLSSHCPGEFVCVFGTCTSACVEDRDCAVAGALCEEEAPGVTACREPLAELCIYDSDCPVPYACAADQTCRLECAEDRDCSPPRICVESLCQLP